MSHLKLKTNVSRVKMSMCEEINKYYNIYYCYTKVDHLGELERPGAVEVENDMILTENMKQGDGRDTAQVHEGI